MKSCTSDFVQKNPKTKKCSSEKEKNNWKGNASEFLYVSQNYAIERLFLSVSASDIIDPNLEKMQERIILFI